MKPSALTGVVLLALAGYVGYHALYLPLQKTLRGLQGQLQESQQTYDLRKGLANSLEKLKTLRQRLAPNAETEWLVREVNRLAESVGIKPPLSITPQRPAKLQEFTSLAVTVEFDTTYHQLGQFISSLERAESFLRLDEFQLMPSERGAARVRLTVSAVHLPPLAGVENPEPLRRPGAAPTVPAGNG